MNNSNILREKDLKKKKLYHFIISQLDEIASSFGLIRDNNEQKHEPLNISKLPEIVRFIDSHFEKQQNFNRDHSSYRLIKIIENCTGKKFQNGDLIIAMLLCGYNRKPTTDKNFNCYFNMKTINQNQLKLKNINHD